MGIQIQGFKRFGACFKRRKGWRQRKVVFSKIYAPRMDTKQPQAPTKDKMDAQKPT